jgi:ketosteroid isomerase-like protein
MTIGTRTEGHQNVSANGPAAGNCRGYELGRSDRISDWFTEDFRLHEPGKPALPVGHEGARKMMEAGRQNRMRAGVQTPVKVEILDMIEEGDRVAVRWQVTATAPNRNPYQGSCVAIYRFENGRIAEDWGIVAPALWP